MVMPAQTNDLETKSGSDEVAKASYVSASKHNENSFTSFDLLPQISRSISKLNFTKATSIQNQMIPLALQGKDIIAKARTGSGKTIAFCIPILQKLLSLKQMDNKAKTRALILVPTGELAHQVSKVLRDLSTYCSKEIYTLCLTRNIPQHQQKPLLAELPDIIVSTPTQIVEHLETKHLDLTQSLEFLVIDEADLILSYGYDFDIKRILQNLPKTYQYFLMSATMSSDIDCLREMLGSSPAILDVAETKEERETLKQYVVKCAEKEKFLLLYFICKLRLIKGKCLIFVNGIDRCYRVKLFLEQFSIRSAVLNSELPINSRFHVVQEFNKGVYDILIASDESDLRGGNDDSDEEQEDEEVMDINKTENMTDSANVSSEKEKDVLEKETRNSRKNKKAQKKDIEYGVSRGIDFYQVQAVINFDFPSSVKAYTHRVGRTARGGKQGVALSFVQVEKKKKNQELQIFEKVEKKQQELKCKIDPFKYDSKVVDSFRYRMEDAFRAVTRASVKEARLKEIKQEILNSEKLKAHFEDNPKDLRALRHDKTLHPARVQNHLKHVPDYLMPNIKGISTEENPNEFVPFHSNKNKKRKTHKGKQDFNQKKRRKDPLNSFRI